DVGGRITLLNGVAQNLTGWSGEAVGKDLADVFRIMDEKTLAPVENPLSRVMRTGKILDLTDHTLLLTRDGREVPIDDSAAPIKDQHGKVIGMVLVFRDISERKQAEATLVESRERLLAALSASGTGTFRWDLRRNALDWDVSLDRLFGLPTGRTIRKLDEFLEAVHPDDRAAVAERCRRCLSEGADLEMDFRVAWPDGSVHWLSYKGKTVRDALGKPLYMTGACLDITTEMLVQESLRQADRRKDEFLAMLAHELRNPLAPIRNALHVVASLGPDDPRLSASLEIIERQVGHLARLVDDLLDVSRITCGKIKLQVRPTNLAEIVAQSAEASRPS